MLQKQKNFRRVWLLNGCLLAFWAIFNAYLCYGHVSGATETDSLVQIAGGIAGEGYSLFELTAAAVSHLPAFLQNPVLIGLMFLCLMLTIPGLYLLLHTLFPDMPQAIALLCTLLTGFVQPLKLPGMRIYQGNITPNVVHNFTSMSCRAITPFVLLAFFACCRQLSQKRIRARDLAAFAVLLAISAAAKPSLAFCLLPVMLVYLIIDLAASRGKNLKNEFVFGCMVFPSLLLCLLQFNVLFVDQSDASGSIIVSPGTVWAHHAGSVPLSFIASFAFPILVTLLLVWRLPCQKQFWLIAACVAVGTAEFFFLMESGPRKWDCNFIWAAEIVDYFWFALCMAAVAYTAWKARTLSALPRRRCWYALLPCCGLLAWHFISGGYFLFWYIQGVKYGTL